MDQVQSFLVEVVDAAFAQLTVLSASHQHMWSSIVAARKAVADNLLVLDEVKMYERPERLNERLRDADLSWRRAMAKQVIFGSQWLADAVHQADVRRDAIVKALNIGNLQAAEEGIAGLSLDIKALQREVNIIAMEHNILLTHAFLPLWQRRASRKHWQKLIAAVEAERPDL